MRNKTQNVVSVRLHNKNAICDPRYSTRDGQLRCLSFDADVTL